MSELFLSDLYSLLLKSNYSQLCRRRFLVLGASGLVGKYFLCLLSHINTKEKLNLSITACCRNVQTLSHFVHDVLEDASIDVRQIDVMQPFSLKEQYDYVLMLASPADPLSYSRKPVETFLSNVIGLRNIIQATLEVSQEKSPRILFVSSGEVYGVDEELNLSGFSETDYRYLDHLNGRSCYSMGKKAAECLCELYKAEFGTDIVIARLCHTYGPTITSINSRADAQFLRNAARGVPIVMKSTGSQIRSYCYVGDCCTALITLLLFGKSGEAYNVANPNSVVSIREYAETLAKISGTELRFELPKEEEKRGFSKVPRAVLNPEKLMKLGWAPVFSLEEGLRHTLEIYKELNVVSR